jgi:hypothetical protein
MGRIQTQLLREGAPWAGSRHDVRFSIRRMDEHEVDVMLVQSGRRPEGGLFRMTKGITHDHEGGLRQEAQRST